MLDSLSATAASHMEASPVDQTTTSAVSGGSIVTVRVPLPAEVDHLLCVRLMPRQSVALHGLLCCLSLAVRAEYSALLSLVQTRK